MPRPSRTILAVATKGSGSNEEQRIRELLSQFNTEAAEFDRGRKLKSGWGLFRRIARGKPALVALEGTGLAGGIACIFGRLICGVPYVLSSGDAVGPWIASRAWLLGPVFGAYERLLCRCCAGFIGWSPYLVGRAMTFGAPRGVTAAGWSHAELPAGSRAEHRNALRRELGIPETDIVFGIVGSLQWSRRRNYCYGLELVRAIKSVQRTDVSVLIVGDGNGVEHLRQLVSELPGRRVILTGAVAAEAVPRYLAAMDFGSLPQSVDGVGNFRYTTKISEYCAARLKVITLGTPMSYDLSADWLIRLPGRAPWDPTFVSALGRFMESASHVRRADETTSIPEFDRARQIARVTEFINDLLADLNQPKDSAA